MKSIPTSPRERARRLRVTGGRVRVTRKARTLNAAERAAVEARLRAEGILPRLNEGN